MWPVHGLKTGLGHTVQHTELRKKVQVITVEPGYHSSVILEMIGQWEGHLLSEKLCQQFSAVSEGRVLEI